MPSAPATRNRTLRLTTEEEARLAPRLLRLQQPAELGEVLSHTLHMDMLQALPLLPDAFADLIFLDPPYRLPKRFGGLRFARGTLQAYTDYLEGWLTQVVAKLKPTGSLYLCGDWQSAAPIQLLLDRLLVVRNRITWEREKGRGARANWKNCSEDIWYATAGEDYYFDTQAVKLRRRVLAPYRQAGQPKDWESTAEGNYRLTHPSNLWTDLTVPFWSMPENTDHPTQKPEKLLAKLLLASTRPGDVVFDPFLGSGTTAVVAHKLGRQWVGIEQDHTYALLAERRLELAEVNPHIQGYEDGVFWERNARRL